MRYESEGSLVTGDALVRKILEYLLQSRLCYTVLLNSKAALFMLQLTEEPSDGLAVLRYTKFEEFAALFEDLNLIEVARKVR